MFQDNGTPGGALADCILVFCSQVVMMHIVIGLYISSNVIFSLSGDAFRNLFKNSHGLQVIALREIRPLIT